MEQVFITVESIIVVFKALFRVFWKFNFSIETISKTSLEPNYTRYIPNYVIITNKAGAN